MAFENVEGRRALSRRARRDRCPYGLVDASYGVSGPPIAPNGVQLHIWSPMGKNLRRKDRRLLWATVEVTWEDGGRRVAKAQILHVSPHGIRLEMSDALPVRRIAHIESSDLGISVNASVRHCNRAGFKFIGGLEFTGGSSWYPTS